MVEHCNSDCETVWWNSLVEQCKSVVEQWNSHGGTVWWNTDGGIVWWNSDGGTVWRNTRKIMV